MIIDRQDSTQETTIANSAVAEEVDLSSNTIAMKTYNAHGKVLLTGEYMILDGAVGIGLPTHHGQTLTIETIESDTPHILRTAHEQ